MRVVRLSYTMAKSHTPTATDARFESAITDARKRGLLGALITALRPKPKRHGAPRKPNTSIR